MLSSQGRVRPDASAEQAITGGPRALQARNEVRKAADKLRTVRQLISDARKLDVPVSTFIDPQAVGVEAVAELIKSGDYVALARSGAQIVVNDSATASEVQSALDQARPGREAEEAYAAFAELEVIVAQSRAAGLNGSRPAGWFNEYRAQHPESVQRFYDEHPELTPPHEVSQRVTVR